MIHPHTEVRFISKEKGYGLVATQLIPKGTITWVQDELDQVVTADQMTKMSPAIICFLETYSFTNKKGEKVLCWDNGKFVNHSFTPSCFSTPYDFEIAIRTIYPGEELTDDYGYLNVAQPLEVMDENAIRKSVYPDDLLTFYKEWDALIKENVPAVLEVAQPLQQFIPTEVWNEFVSAVHRPEQLRSLLECYYKPIIPNTSEPSSHS
ncbi:SET domain-containing protein [Flavobacterium orientale]|uniref:SET domain-containing protein n=1 Tax=Flavobacterium orientale TaxID=1756020 RepID=A0A916Y8F5_9FLAO|nr:SET domain-containing protein [Flavobacterium orientale]GGD35153.1 hypothetical protein GCM10011343_26270 [Flavobacterium orientale]